MLREEVRQAGHTDDVVKLSWSGVRTAPVACRRCTRQSRVLQFGIETLNARLDCLALALAEDSPIQVLIVWVSDPFCYLTTG